MERCSDNRWLNSQWCVDFYFEYRNPLAQMEEEKREHDMKMKKMEAEMEQVFEMKVKEKKQKLKDSEAELTRRHEERKKVNRIVWWIYWNNREYPQLDVLFCFVFEM